MPLFTTSRKPCARVRTLVKEFARIIPSSISLTRGKQSIDELAETARQEGYEKVVVVTGMHGNPHTIRVLEVSESDWAWSPKSFVIKSVKLAREFKSRVKRPDALDSEDSIGFVEALGVTPEQSTSLLKADSEAITFFQEEIEVGPRLVLRGIRDES